MRNLSGPDNGLRHISVAANGEVEGPDDHVGQAPRAHTLSRAPRRQSDRASPPPLQRWLGCAPVQRKLNLAKDSVGDVSRIVRATHNGLMTINKKYPHLAKH